MKNILLYFAVTTICLISYFFMGDKETYVASNHIHGFAIIVPLLILLNVKKLNIYASLFIYCILLWHIIDVTCELFKLK